MSNGEYRPNVPPPRLLRGNKTSQSAPAEERPVVDSGQESSLQIVEQIGEHEDMRAVQSKAVAVSDEREESSTRSEGVVCEACTVADEMTGNGGRDESAYRRYGCSVRDGDPCICPNPGAPRFMQGCVKPKVAPIVAEDCQSDENTCNDYDRMRDKSSVSFLPFLGWACCVIVTLWIVTVSSPFLANALTLHGWRFWVSLVLALLPLLLVFGVVLYAMMRFRRIPRIEQFSESSFVDKPEELQDKIVVHYLGKIADPQGYAVENGFVEEGNVTDDLPIVDSLKRLKGDIPSHCSGSDGWLYLFKDFQRMQDERAREIIGKTWKLVAIKTAASPWKIVDMIAVVYNSMVMITKLAKLYNRGASSQAAFRLVCRWIINIYIAGEAGDAAQGAVEWANANDLISSTYKPLAGFLGKIAEGGANAFLVYRLGCRAMEYFRPLRLEREV